MNSEIKYDYYCGNESEQFSFYRIPKYLFTEVEFKCLSVESKVLFGLLLDRMSLSVKNNWFDKLNRVYIIYAVEEVMNDLNCGNEKAIKLFRELSVAGLIERKNQGQGKPAKIFVKNFIKTANDESENTVSKVGNADFSSSEVVKTTAKTSENRNSENNETELLNVRKPECSNTEYNNTEFIYTNQSYQSYHGVNDEIDKTDKTDMTEKYKRIIKQNLEYDIACQKYDKIKVNEIYELILETVCSPSPTIRVNKTDYPQEVVKSRFLKFDEEALDYVMMTLGSNTKKIGNIRSYLLTTIFNAPVTKDHYLTAEVNHNMYGGAENDFHK